MSAYESLAACYDELTYDIRYEKTLTFFERLCAREHVQPHLVLDLACGTGSLSMLLAEHGYRVIGADLSEEMLAEAEQKARDLPEDIRPFFISFCNHGLCLCQLIFTTVRHKYAACADGTVKHLHETFL